MAWRGMAVWWNGVTEWCAGVQCKVGHGNCVWQAWHGMQQLYGAMGWQEGGGATLKMVCWGSCNCAS